MKNHGMTVFIVAAFVAFYGCEKVAEKTSPQKGANATTTNVIKKINLLDYSRLNVKDVLVRVGTNEITKADIEKLVNLRLKIIRLGLSEEQRKFALNRSAVSTPLIAALPQTYRGEVAVLKWAAEKGIVADAAGMAEYRKGFLRGCKAEEANYEDFMAKNFTKEERATAEARIAVEATCAKVRKVYLEQNPVSLKKSEVDAFLKRVVDYNAKANATNDLVWARATNVWVRAKGGENFKELAAELTEDEAERDEGGVWGAYSLGELEKEEEGELARAVSTLDVGGITPPVESDNGLVIARIDKITDAYGNELGNGPRPFGALYELSRIYLRLAQTYEVPDLAESEVEIRTYHEQEAFNKFVTQLIAKDGVEYPSGKLIFETAKKSAQMPQMLMQEGVTNEDLKKARKSK